MSEEERRLTLRKAKILEVLNHPNIIRFREVYKKKAGQLCIVMDYADGKFRFCNYIYFPVGGNLGDKIKEGKASGKLLPEEQVLNWFTQIVLPMKHVHDRKIIHRDIKSQNVFLTKSGMAKLGDFGAARVMNNTRDLQTNKIISRLTLQYERKCR